MQTNYCMAHTVHNLELCNTGLVCIAFSYISNTRLASHAIIPNPNRIPRVSHVCGQCNLIRVSRVIVHSYCLGPCASDLKTGEHKAQVWRDDPIQSFPAVDQTSFVEQIEQMDHKAHKWINIRALL